MRRMNAEPDESLNAKMAHGNDEEDREKPGKRHGVALQRAAPVPTKPQRAAERLVEVGVPEFRCDERIGAQLATRFLQTKNTTVYVEAQNHLKMPQLREA